MIKLNQYVEKRIGLALGAPGSLQKMLFLSLGANSFSNFWRYWNPIWGYYLSRNIMRPLSKWLPQWFAIVMTFAVSGALHDLAVALLKWQIIFFFTPWFTVMGLAVLLTEKLGIKYVNFPWTARALFNLTIIVVCYSITAVIDTAFL